MKAKIETSGTSGTAQEQGQLEQAEQLRYWVSVGTIFITLASAGYALKAIINCLK